MFLPNVCGIFGIAYFGIYVCAGAFFETNITRVYKGKDVAATLDFTVTNTYTTDTTSLVFVKVFIWNTNFILSDLICTITFERNVCSDVQGCTCKSELKIFSVTRETASNSDEQWMIVAKLGNGQRINQTVHMSLGRSLSLEPTTSTKLNSGRLLDQPQRKPVEKVTQFPTALQVSSDTNEGFTDTNTSLEPPDIKFIALLGSIGFVLLLVISLAAVVGVLFKKKVGGTRRLPLPPANPNVTRAAGNGVMFRVPPLEHRDRDSSVSGLGHDYDEIPGNTVSEQSESPDSLTIYDSSPVSDSSMSDDCLHHIACPSSDSSLPEDYLHPVASSSNNVY